MQEEARMSKLYSRLRPQVSRTICLPFLKKLKLKSLGLLVVSGTSDNLTLMDKWGNSLPNVIYWYVQGSFKGGKNIDQRLAFFTNIRNDFKMQSRGIIWSSIILEGRKSVKGMSNETYSEYGEEVFMEST